MPIEFLTCLDRDFVYARWWGHIESRTRLRNFENYLQDVHYKPGRTELVDLSGVTASDWDLDRARKLLRHVDARSDIVRTRTVIWAPTDTTYGCARMYQSLAEITGRISVEIFWEEQNALSAIDLPYQRIEDMLAREVFAPHEKRTLTSLEERRLAL